MGWLAEEVGWLPSNVSRFGARHPQALLCSATKNGGDELYLLWHRHCVVRHRLKFPWEIRDEAIKANQYHMNDMAFLDASSFAGVDRALGQCTGTTGCWYQMASERAELDKNPLANPADLWLPKRSAPGGAAAQFFDWAVANSAQPGFWDGFHGFPRAVDTVSPRYKNFDDVFTAAIALQKLGEDPSDAVQSRANLYYWAHTNFADINEETVELKLACQNSPRKGARCEWPSWDVFAHYTVEDASTSIESLSNFLRHRAKCDQIYTKNRALGPAQIDSTVQIINKFTRQITFSDSVDPKEMSDAKCAPSCEAAKNLVMALRGSIAITIKVGANAPEKRWLYAELGE
jgi:hypothetical protein